MQHTWKLNAAVKLFRGLLIFDDVFLQNWIVKIHMVDVNDEKMYRWQIIGKSSVFSASLYVFIKKYVIKQ